jgi:type I restriction enzyme, S subunit
MSFDLPLLPNGWAYSSLEACARKQSISYGVVQPGAALETGIPIIRVNNFKDGRIDIDDLMKISPEIESKYARTRLVGGEVLITLVGSVGQVAVAPKTVSGFNVARAVAVIHPEAHVSPNWIAICLRSPLSQHLLVSRANTTVQTTINLKDLRALPLPLPPIGEREQIENFITALDDRIALLRETNATLEAIAQALFKSWFVDFDPVHANAGTQAPSLPPEIQALFPATFTDSPQGPIPDGWYAGQIGDVISIKGGYAFKSSDFQDSGSPVIKIKNIVGDGTVDCSDVQRVSESVASKAQRFILNSGDILMAMTGATIGKVGIYVAETNQNALVNQRVAKFENKNADEKNTWLAFIAFSNSFMTDQVVNAASGSAQPNISSTGIESAKLVVPADKNVLKAFNSIVDPLFQTWINNQKMVRLLSNLRDTLLPRLISGQLRLPEAEQAIAAITD